MSLSLPSNSLLCVINHVLIAYKLLMNANQGYLKKPISVLIFLNFIMRLSVSVLTSVDYSAARHLCYHFQCQIALITWNSFGEEAGKGCK